MLSICLSDYVLENGSLKDMDHFLNAKTTNKMSFKLTDENMLDFIKISDTNFLIRLSENDLWALESDNCTVKRLFNAEDGPLGQI